MEKDVQIKFNFFSTAISDILKAVEGKSLTGAYILTFCGIDYMGLALNPHQKNTKNDFKKYVEGYMGKYNASYTKYSNHLYAIRCSLVHSYGPSDATKSLGFMPFLRYDDPERFFHLIMEKKNEMNVLHLALPDLISDFIISVIDFFEEKEGQDFNFWQSTLFYQTGCGMI